MIAVFLHTVVNYLGLRFWETHGLPLPQAVLIWDAVSWPLPPAQLTGGRKTALPGVDFFWSGNRLLVIKKSC